MSCTWQLALGMAFIILTSSAKRLHARVDVPTFKTHTLTRPRFHLYS